MLLNCGVGVKTWESFGLQGDPTSPSEKKSVLNIHWKDWCWSWNSNTLVTWCKELTHLKIPWCWEWLKVGEEGDDRGWDGWMASLIQRTWVWVSSRSCWWMGKPGVLPSMGSQRVRHNWVTELNWSSHFLILKGFHKAREGNLVESQGPPATTYFSLWSPHFSMSPTPGCLGKKTKTK